MIGMRGHKGGGGKGKAYIVQNESPSWYYSSAPKKSTRRLVLAGGIYGELDP